MADCILQIRDVVDIINDVPVDWKGFKIPKKTNQKPNLTNNQVCLSVCLSFCRFLCIDYYTCSLLLRDFDDD